MQSFVSGKDTLVILPTGYGKSMIYGVLPKVFDYMLGKHKLNLIDMCHYNYWQLHIGSEGSIVVVVTPLTALMLDQKK